MKNRVDSWRQNRLGVLCTTCFDITRLWPAFRDNLYR